MKIYCNEKVPQKILKQDDWVVSDEKENIATGIEAGCNTIYIGNETDSIRPSLFAPSVEYAMQFILANAELD
ncbi:MAG: hypothetical protein QF444_00260 [Phycisphaerales bacterium]|nr:hypothetical protein [Phycisphaerales bacterium]